MLLEPWYQFTPAAAPESVGRALADMPGFAPSLNRLSPRGRGGGHWQGASGIFAGYAREVTALPRGGGSSLACLLGMPPATTAEEVIAAAGYDIDGDLENTADSVFCSHGAGVLVRWDKVPSRMHLPSVLARGAFGPCP